MGNDSSLQKVKSISTRVVKIEIYREGGGEGCEGRKEREEGKQKRTFSSAFGASIARECFCSFVLVGRASSESSRKQQRELTKKSVGGFAVFSLKVEIARDEDEDIAYDRKSYIDSYAACLRWRLNSEKCFLLSL